MTWFRPTTLLDKVFEGSLLLKGVSALLEVIGAALLIFIPSRSAIDFVGLVTQKELFEDPNDIIANTLIHATNSLWSTSHVFAIAFLLIHATIKFVIVFGLLKDLRWAYPFSFVSLILIILYQTYDLFTNFSTGMVLLTLFDTFVLWLIYREYRIYSKSK